MKNISKFARNSPLILILFIAATSFTNKVSNLSIDNSCTVTIKYYNGSAAKSVKVRTEVSGGISCCGGRDFYTDKYGKVSLKWSNGCYLRKIYVKGKGYEVDYRDGGDYSLIIKD